MNVSRLLAFTNSYLKEVGKGIHKKACVVGASVFGGSLVLVKDRDRNYRPKLQIIHELVDDVEVAYIHDIGTQDIWKLEKAIQRLERLINEDKIKTHHRAYLAYTHLKTLYDNIKESSKMFQNLRDVLHEIE